MATVKGVWVFNETLAYTTTFTTEYVNFNSGEVGYIGIRSQYSGEFVCYVLDIYGDADVGYDAGWINEAYRTVNFGSTEQTVSDEFYAWLTANAIQQLEESGNITITYGDSVISSINYGQTATLKCMGLLMESDVIVRATEQKDFALQEKTVIENGEITPDTGYYGLSKVTVNVPSEAIEEYDGSVSMSGVLISFTIVSTQYLAEEGMTWTEWCDSVYNTDGYYLNSDNTIACLPIGYVTLNGNTEYGNNIIIAEAAYSVGYSGGSND